MGTPGQITADHRVGTTRARRTGKVTLGRHPSRTRTERSRFPSGSWRLWTRSHRTRRLTTRRGPTLHSPGSPPPRRRRTISSVSPTTNWAGGETTKSRGLRRQRGTALAGGTEAASTWTWMTTTTTLDSLAPPAESLCPGNSLSRRPQSRQMVTRTLAAPAAAAAVDRPSKIV